MANTRFLKVADLRVTYIGPGTEDSDAASVRADHCVPQASGIYYYEIEVASFPLLLFFLLSRVPCVVSL